MDIEVMILDEQVDEPLETTLKSEKIAHFPQGTTLPTQLVRVVYFSQIFTLALAPRKCEKLTTQRWEVFRTSPHFTPSAYVIPQDLGLTVIDPVSSSFLTKPDQLNAIMVKQEEASKPVRCRGRLQPCLAVISERSLLNNYF
jgi:hypothetical protein